MESNQTWKVKFVYTYIHKNMYSKGSISIELWIYRSTNLATINLYNFLRTRNQQKRAWNSTQIWLNLNLYLLCIE